MRCRPRPFASRHGLTVLAILGPGDELVAPAHDLADVGKAKELDLARGLKSCFAPGETCNQKDRDTKTQGYSL